jgi:hypothetical protein
VTAPRSTDGLWKSTGSKAARPRRAAALPDLPRLACDRADVRAVRPRARGAAPGDNQTQGGGNAPYKPDDQALRFDASGPTTTFTPTARHCSSSLDSMLAGFATGRTLQADHVRGTDRTHSREEPWIGNPPRLVHGGDEDERFALTSDRGRPTI